MSKNKGSFCIDYESYDDVAHKKLKKIYKGMAKGRMCKYAVASLIETAEFCASTDYAVRSAFHIDPAILTKKERKVADLCFNIAESTFLGKLNKLILTNDKISSNMKVIAEIRGMVDANRDINTPGTGLSVHVHTDAEKVKQKEPEREMKKNNVVEMKPLLLGNDG